MALVAAGVVAKKIITSFSGEKKIDIEANILEIGGERDLEKGLQKAVDAKDSVGGLLQCRVNNLPIGLGEPFFDSAESLISHVVFSIPAVKGIEFGAGFAAAKMFGLEHNDALLDADGTTRTNHAGGIVGGITNGNELIFRVVVNHEEQYSIWPEYKAIPQGWNDTGIVGDKKACLEYVEKVWTDMRPLSLRQFMDKQAASISK